MDDVDMNPREISEIELPRDVHGRIRLSPESIRDLKEPHRYLDKFWRVLASVSFADRFDALCATHPKRGPEVPVAVRHAAIEGTGRKWVYHRCGKYWAFRETEDGKTILRGGLGLDVTIDARVECELLFAVPSGHLGTSFPRMAKHSRRVDDRTYEPRRRNAAPRIGTEADLPVILAECLALYDVVADALRAESWPGGWIKAPTRAWACPGYEDLPRPDT